MTFSMLLCQSSQAVGLSSKTGSGKLKVATESVDQVNIAKEVVFNKMPQSINNGEKRFNQTCVYCHGYQGSGGKAKKLQGRKLVADRLFKTITKGKRKGGSVMPPWRKAFSIEERWELVTYIMSLSDLK